MSAFDRLHPALQHHIVNSLGWRELRPVQTLSIEACLEGHNVVILAPTAGGKTEAAFFPAISQMLAKSWIGLSILYVSPIRALLNNQEERLQRYFRLVGRSATCWHGDTSQSNRRRIVAQPPDCLLTTPESLEARLVSPGLDHHHFFQNVRLVVIDELHAFAGDDRGWHLLSVLARIQKLARRDLQRVGLSATVGNPEEMLAWLSAGSNRRRRVIVPEAMDSDATPNVQLDYVGSLANAAKIISLLHQGEKRLVFCDSRARVEELTLMLREREVETFVSHSSLGVEERRAAEQAFAQKQNCVIVATSALELGIDVGDLDRVIQIDAPSRVSSFLQRMGRTGRRANTIRNCLFLATNDAGLLRAAALIDLWRRGYVEPVQAPSRPYHIIAQQLMALILQERGVGRTQWLPWIESVPAFAEMPVESIAAVVDFMVAEGILWSDSGVLAFAPEGESKFGRRNFMEILSVFTSEPSFRVMAGQKELGFVHESTFYRREGPALLVLAGRSWRATNVDWSRRIAHVEPADEKGESRWMGEGQMLSYEVCQSIRRILSADHHDPSWSRRTTDHVKNLREDFSWISCDSTAIVRQSDSPIRWWTFGGGIANTLLADALKSECNVNSDNLSLRFPTEASVEAVAKRIDGLEAESIKPIPNVEVIDNLKFSECLPPQIAAEVFVARFADPVAVRQVLGERRRVVVEGE